MKILFTLIRFRNLYRVFKSFLSEISTAATVPTGEYENNYNLYFEKMAPNNFAVLDEICHWLQLMELFLRNV
jgi:hypothetical protein